MGSQRKNKIDFGPEPNDPGEETPKQDWPIGPLRDIPLDGAEQAEKPFEPSEEPKSNKQPDPGSEQWPSVSWP